MEEGKIFEIDGKSYISQGVDHCAGCIAENDPLLCGKLSCGNVHDCDCVIYKELPKE